MIVRFDDAWAGAVRVAELAAARTRLGVVLVRDLRGRLSLVVDDSDVAQLSDSLADYLRLELENAAGPFMGSMGVARASELFAAEQILRASDLVTIKEATETAGRVSTLERGVVGGEWLHLPRAAEDAEVHRVTLYGFKGGVGRSTAAFMLAHHLATRGLCVLAVDLDLESPGVGALLQGNDYLPDYGLVDYLAESAVGNQEGLDLVVKSQLAQVGGNGEVWVAPASGRARDGYEYVAKLNRAYLDVPGEDGVNSLAGRLEAAVCACEHEVTRLSREPDIVLLDSRAGIHDIAAVAITQLADLSLLFGSDSTATWNGYRSLFQQWQSPEHARAIRERLRMVAALVPRDRREEYLERFRDHAQACFAATLYDDVPSGLAFDDGDGLAEAELFNPAPDDESAPHSPLPVFFVPEFIGMDLATRPGWHEIDRGAYTAFLDGVTDLIFGETA